jgi:hypothetical protein
MQVARDDNAYRDDVPDNGKLFPDGSKITKIEWFFEKNTVSPYFVTVPDTLKTVASAEAKGTKWDIIKNDLDRDFYCVR